MLCLYCCYYAKSKLDRAEDQRSKLLEEKEDQKKRESALQDSVKALDKQNSDLTVGSLYFLVYVFD